MKLLATAEIAMRTRSLNDQERDPIARNARVRDERQRAHMRALIALPPRNWPPGHLAKLKLLVALTRVSPKGRLDAHDNLRGALKHVVDGICAHLGIDDGDESRIRFTYEQATGPWAVRFSVLEDTPNE